MRAAVTRLLRIIRIKCRFSIVVLYSVIRTSLTVCYLNFIIIKGPSQVIGHKFNRLGIGVTGDGGISLFKFVGYR